VEIKLLNSLSISKTIIRIHLCMAIQVLSYFVHRITKQWLNSLARWNSMLRTLTTNTKLLNYPIHKVVFTNISTTLIFQNLVSTTWNIAINDFVDNHFFNCSLLIRDKMDSYLVPCLSTSTSQIYAIPSYESIDYLPLSFCTKMFNVSLNSNSGSVRNQNFLRLMWSEPNCKHCESKGNRCGWKNTTGNSTNKEVDCFAKNHKGNFYLASYLYSELLFRFSSLDTNT
jgi:hypothetical protein